MKSLLASIMLCLVACSDPMSVGPDIDHDQYLILIWSTTQSQGGEWLSIVTGDTDYEGEFWVRFNLSTSIDSLLVGGPPPLTAGITHNQRNTPINYKAELFRKAYNTGESGWSWEIIASESDTYEAPIIP